MLCFFFFWRREDRLQGLTLGTHSKTLKCVKDNPKENKTLWPVVSFRGHLFVLVMIQLVSPVGVWRCRVFCATTRASSWLTAVYFVCVAKRLRLRSPFLFSQWKGEIDGYHLCGAALFGRYQTFFTGIAAFFPEQMITHTHTGKDSFILSWMFFCFFLFFFAASFSSPHLRHSCWCMCTHAFLHIWKKDFKKCVRTGYSLQLRAALYYYHFILRALFFRGIISVPMDVFETSPGKSMSFKVSLQ